MSYSYSSDPGRTTLEALFGLLKQRHYAGSVTIHFDNGRPLVAEYGRPTRVEIQARLNGAAALGATSVAHAREVGGPDELTVVGRPEP